MIVDSSAIIAILRAEPEAMSMAQAMARAQCKLSAASFVEVGAIIDGSRDPIASRRYDDLLSEAKVSIEPVTLRQAYLARDAYRDFGRGSGHPARLNFGDCFSYALARDSGEPLLYVGNDFSHTDIPSAADA